MLDYYLNISILAYMTSGNFLMPVATNNFISNQ